MAWLILKWMIAALSIMTASYLVPGVSVASAWTALWLALFFGLVNATLKPLLIVLTLPINIITLGLFIFVINAVLVLLAATVIKGFIVSGFWTALLFSIVLSLISYLLNIIFRGRERH